MLKKICIIILLIIPLVLAQEDSPNIILTFVDAISKEPIEETYVKLDLNGETSNYYLEKEETLRLNLVQGNYHLKILINDPNTEGNDYYGEVYLPVKNNLVKVIYLYPGGSLSGFVKDKLDTVISNANLKFECNKVISIDYPTKADKFGSFSLDYVPEGRCKVYGSYSNSIGIEEINIQQGERTNINIKLDNVLITPEKKDYSIMIIALFIPTLLILILLIVMFRSKIKTLIKKEKKEDRDNKELPKEKEEGRQDLGQRGKDILKTLRDNEKKIVEFLLNQEEPTHLSKIHYKTGISKGALFRNLESLEKKNIIESIREGKVRKAKLSAWFLE